MKADNLDHDLVFVEEFDALNIAIPTGAASPAEAGAPLASSAKREKYPAKLHARKVAKELGVEDGLIFLPGLPSQSYEDSDMGPQFRQRRYFYYLGGLDFEDCAVTYDLARDHLVLWVPYIDPRQVLWFGKGPDPDACKATIDIDDVFFTKDLGSYLHHRLTMGSHVTQAAQSAQTAQTAAKKTREGHWTVGASVGSDFCSDSHRHATATVASAAAADASASASTPSSSPTVLYVLHASQMPSLEVLPLLQQMAKVVVDSERLLPAMDAARVIKTPYEIALIRHANDISSGAHRAVLQQLHTFANEREIEAAYLHYCIAAHGAKHQAYAIIAGSGPNAAVLHYGANDEPLAGRQLVCLDAGAEWQLYASDVTRTFPVSGTFSPEAAAIYAAVNHMQSAVIARFRPGVAFRDLHLLAARIAAQELLRLGILQGGGDGGSVTPTQLVESGVVSAFFPHGLGHHVGLEVHDVLSPDLMAAADAATTWSGTAWMGGMGRMGKRQVVPPHMYPILVRDSMREAKARRMGGSVSSASTSAAAASKRPRRRLLEPGMIITVEPGIYFCRPYIETFFLAQPKFARFINQTVLEQYYDVGGVRIEDCVLVTEEGHENLTTAPKGEEALRIIRGESVACV